MDAFEQIVDTILRLDGYWTHRLFHVELTKREKHRLGLPTMPRPELDIIAYRPKSNELLVVECKSFLDSDGVRARAFKHDGNRFSRRFKLFVGRRLWNVVRSALVRELRARGACRPRPAVRLCLAAGRIASDRDRQMLHRLFDRRGWRLIDDVEIAERLAKAVEEGYTDDVAILAAKILVPKERHGGRA